MTHPGAQYLAEPATRAAKSFERMRRVSEASGIQTVWPTEAEDVLALLAAEKARADAAEAERDELRLDLAVVEHSRDTWKASSTNWWNRAEKAEATIASLTEKLAEIGRAWVTVGHHEGIEISVNHDAAETWNALCALLDPLARATLSRLEKQEGEA